MNLIVFFFLNYISKYKNTGLEQTIMIHIFQIFFTLFYKFLWKTSFSGLKTNFKK